MPDRVIIEMFKLGDFNSTGEIEKHLDILENSVSLAPTHWAVNERPTSKRKYDRNKVLLHGKSYSNYNLVHLYRNQVPTYTLYYLSSSYLSPSSFQLTFENAEHLDSNVLKEIFETSSIFAEQLEVVFGYVWMAWNSGYGRYMPRSTINASELVEYGPNPVSARTWFGPYLVKLIGRDQLDQCGAVVHDTVWSGVELNLVSEPWHLTLDSLLEHQKKVMESLEQTEIFGDYRKFPIFYPGRKWVWLTE